MARKRPHAIDSTQTWASVYSDVCGGTHENHRSIIDKSIGQDVSKDKVSKTQEKKKTVTFRYSLETGRMVIASRIPRQLESLSSGGRVTHLSQHVLRKRDVTAPFLSSAVDGIFPRARGNKKEKWRRVSNLRRVFVSRLYTRRNNATSGRFRPRPSDMAFRHTRIRLQAFPVQWIIIDQVEQLALVRPCRP